MKLKDVLYKTPEMTEEKLLEIIKKNLPTVKNSIKRDVSKIHPETELSQAFLDEFDLIQEKKSKLSRDQRDDITGFVGLCIIKMTNGGETSSTN
jgi:hypothetical protein